MDVITIESKAFKELMSKVDMIARFVDRIEKTTEINIDDEWVDSYDVRTYLNINKRTLQRLRSEGLITFSTARSLLLSNQRDKAIDERTYHQIHARTTIRITN